MREHPEVHAWFVRSDRRYTKAMQVTAIKKVDPDPHVYVEGEGEEEAMDAIRHCDTGEVVGVVGVHRLAGRWTAIARLIEKMRQRGVKLYDLERSIFIELESAAAIYEAQRIVNGLASMPSSEIAADRGAKGGKGDIWLNMTMDDRKAATEEWISADTAAQAAANVGVSRETMYRWQTMGRLPVRGIKQN